jgi:hypothetical protein
MVTAVLPTVTGSSATLESASGCESQRLEQNGHPRSTRECTRSLSSEPTVTSAPLSRNEPTTTAAEPSSSRLAGFVGLFAGCGALIALGLFLPLPAVFEQFGWSPDLAIMESYYVVGVIALAISVSCFVGLRNLRGEEEMGWHSLWKSSACPSGATHLGPPGRTLFSDGAQLCKAFVLGFERPAITLGYVGGFVARASSVGISLFIPLFVNHYYRVSGLCHETQQGRSGDHLGEVKKLCPEAYILASILTGVSQLVALISAPVYGFLCEKWPRHQLPLHFAAFSGLVGYVGFPLLPSPQFRGPSGNSGVFVIMALVGLSQIGAIVCSLAVLSNGVLNIRDSNDSPSQPNGLSEPSDPECSTLTSREADSQSTEVAPLLRPSVDPKTGPDLRRMKGAIAGIYSLYGGAGILLLTKMGGVLFDILSPGAPFYILAVFNGILLVVCIWCNARSPHLRKAETRI